MNAPQDLAVLGTRIITVNLPTKQDIDGQASNMLESANALVIDSGSMHMIAAEELHDVKSAATKLEEARKLHVTPLNNEVKYINDWFRSAKTMLDEAEAAIKAKMLTYQTEQERIARAEQQRLEEEARIERARIAAENAARERVAQEEAQRQRAAQEAALRKEQAAKAEAARQQVEIDTAVKAGDEARAKEATRLQIEAEAAANREKEVAQQAQKNADATLDEANKQTVAHALVEMVMTAPVVSIAPKVAGISTKGTYKGECTDLLALVKFIAANPQYVNLVKANDTAINQTAKAQRGATKIDGIRVWEEKTIAARRA